ncbi:MAG: UDP-N-acetylmuramate:L-alanyl-gamma-D-glutamyl-meso-diaminopimelate ligase [Pseudomonadota bacterium]
MDVHILGICGTFMGGIAIMAKRLGFNVSGCDENVYPPMSTQLEEQGITLIEGYDPAQLEPAPDLVIIGNALSRGNPAVEYVLDRGLPYMSGPQWLAEHVLSKSWVVAVAGTHGKTTTASMIAWILQHAGLNPSFLIGGVPLNLGISAKVSESPFFVIEADEYDTAFFDKRSKFVHYHPRTTLLNNLEFDHADIFPDLEAIKTQFHHLLRIVPSNGLIIRPEQDTNLDDVLEKGVWSPIQTFGQEGTLRYQNATADFSAFDVYYGEQLQGRIEWSQVGEHNAKNALAAIAAAKHCGVKGSHSIDALNAFLGVKRRLEILDTFKGITIYDDFAHHPTAIKATLAGLRASVGNEQRIIAVLDPRSNTMKMGVHKEDLVEALNLADKVIIHDAESLLWSVQAVFESSSIDWKAIELTEQIVEHLMTTVRKGDHLLLMSNGGFDGLYNKLLEKIKAKP